MYYYLNGILTVLEPSVAVIECGGVGYMCCVSARTEQKLSPFNGKQVKVFTYLSVREDAMELFGFGDKSELTMFKLLISVSGVGARTAIAILGSVSPEKFAYAVSVGDVKGIKAPGVGPKIAARIILELKDKIAKEMPADSSVYSAPAGGSRTGINRGNLAEAAEALTALGYDKNTVSNAISGLDPNADVGELIRLALKKLSF